MIFLSLRGLMKEIFFSKKISYFDIFKLTRYYYPHKKLIFGFSREEVYTAYIDISINENTFFSNFKKNTKYEINRAKREGIIFEEEKNIKLFYNYYNEFAATKQLEFIKYKTLLKYKDYFIITKAVKDKLILSMHLHIYNDDIAILLYSASQFRNIKDKKIKNLIGYSNRFLHFEDMLYFKNIGCIYYDFGGYAYNTDDKSKQNINQFKDSFSCIPKKRYIYTSWLLYSLIFIKNILRLKIQKL